MFSGKSLIKSIVVLLCCTAVIAGAEETNAGPADTQIEEIVVTGSSYVDVQGLVPNIALERIEVVKDGAYDYYTHDPRGRIFYARYRMQF